MIGIDTNVVLRYLVQDDAAQAARATEFFASLTPDAPGFISTVVWAETYWVLTRGYRFDRHTATTQLHNLAMSDEIKPEDGRAVAEATSAVLESGADFADALIASTARRAGAQSVVTFDKAAAKKLGWRQL